MKKAESFLKAMLLKEHEDRLKSVSLLKEVSVTDKDGKIILEPDLKVRHKDSGFEYTIKKVVDTHGIINIVLRTPDSPRVQASPTSSKVLAGTVEKEDIPKKEFDNEEFAVEKEEFEKSYEVD